MDSKKNKELCLSLMKADTEEEVIQLLRQAGYWDNPAVWRYYGDNENNFSTIGSQQSHPEAALVEKLVNSVDARLMGKCLERESDPEGVSAPKTTREAVARFFEDNPTISTAGLMREWPDSKRTEISRGITLAATGAMPSEGKPCLTIADNGEGQMPRMMPNTFLSLTNKSNKLRIPFVQGKFNMGGTGVLRFCGQHNLELILSRRNPAVVDGNLPHPSDLDWGFTVVRRENPEGSRRSSVYTYLAPVDVGDPHGKNGEVLHFSAKTMPIFPDGREAYGRDSKWGTLIKLYEYSLTGSKSHILRKKGLMGRIDLLMPDVALPIRFHECRSGYRGHEGSFETTLTGIGVRLDDDRADNLEPGFPSSCPMSIAGEQMTATIYAFKKGKSETYRRNEGIVFTINGQTHGHFTTDFFRRSRLGLSYLRDSILVIVDCSKLTGRAREDLFMNSRDRLSGGELRTEIEETLEGVLKQHSGLRELKERRRREEIEDKLEDSKPLEDVLESLLKQSPTLTKLFLQGGSIPNPFKTKEARGQEEVFEGKRYPTYFKFKGKDYGIEFRRGCHINTRCRVEFETDVQNDYFSRDIDQGEFSLLIMSDDHRLPVKNYTLNLQNGIATLNLQLPVNCRMGDELRFAAVVTDRTQIDPFMNVFLLNIERPSEATLDPGGKRRERYKHSQDDKGDSHQMPLGIQLPKIIKVYESPGDDTKKGWQDMSPPFNKYSALRVINAGSSDEHGENGNGKNVFDFFLNVDNIFLKTEQKAGNHEPEMAEARFIYGIVLLGLSLLHQDVQEREPQSEPEDGSDSKIEQGCIEDKVEELTKAVAPVLLPMIDYLGDLDLDNGSTVDTSGEAA